MGGNRLSLMLFTSVAFNLLALGAAGYAFYRHGDLASLKDRISHSKPANTISDPDEISYMTRETLFEQLPTRGHAVVFLGDSQTANCEWGELFPGAINRGIGGDTSAGLLKRIPAVVGLKPKAVFLMIGANDFARGIRPTETAANVKSTISVIREFSPDTLIYVESLTPTRWNRRNLFASEVNTMLQSLADGKKTFYIDTYAPFLEGDLLNSRYSFDGLHLNGAGFMLWKRLLNPHVSRLIEPD